MSTSLGEKQNYNLDDVRPASTLFQNRSVIITFALMPRVLDVILLPSDEEGADITDSISLLAMLFAVLNQPDLLFRNDLALSIP